MRTLMNKSYVRLQASDAGNTSNSGNTAVVEDSGEIIVPVSFNASYKKVEKIVDGKKKMVPETVKVPDPKDPTKQIDQKVVLTPAKTVKAVITAPKFAELTPDILVSLYNDRVARIASQYVKSEDDSILVNDAELRYTISAADLLQETSEISDELVEKAQNAFMEYLAKQGKTEKAQRNNALYLVASKQKIATSDPKIVAGYEANLTKFIEASDSDLIVEIEPVITRANRRLEAAKNLETENFI